MVGRSAGEFAHPDAARITSDENHVMSKFATSQVKGKVGEIIEKKDERKAADELVKILEIDHLLEREVMDLSGGELQR